MEILNFLESYWQVLTGVVLVFIGAAKAVYDIRGLQRRIATVENELQKNFTNDTEAKETVTKKLTRMDRKFDYFGTVIQVMASHLQIKIPEPPKFDEE